MEIYVPKFMLLKRTLQTLYLPRGHYFSLSRFFPFFVYPLPFLDFLFIVLVLPPPLAQFYPSLFPGYLSFITGFPSLVPGSPPLSRFTPPLSLFYPHHCLTDFGITLPVNMFHVLAVALRKMLLQIHCNVIKTIKSRGHLKISPSLRWHSWFMIHLLKTWKFHVKHRCNVSATLILLFGCKL